MSRRSPISWLLAGAGLGAAAMFLLDPQRGRRRRHVLEDRFRGTIHDVENLTEKAQRDLKNRAHGVSARLHGSPPTRRTVKNAVSQGMPVRRLLDGTVGVGLLVFGVARRGLTGAAASVAGAWLLARAAVERQHGVIRVQKTITLDAPIERVFGLWSNPEHFPRFMNHVLEVRTDGPRSHWRVAGPAHIPLAWSAEITESIEGKKLAWRSLDDSPIAHHGEVHFEPVDHDATRVSIHMAYDPPAGALGHAIAFILRADPKHLLDRDLLDMKSMLERDQQHQQREQPPAEETHLPR